MSNGSDRIPVEPRSGVYLPEIDLHLDSRRRVDFGFVSHAHADHFARHRKLICSRRTAELISVRYGRGKSEVLALDYHDPYEFGGYTIELIPAGHIFGSAQIHLTRISDGASLLYTGDFKVRKGLAAEPVAFKQADTLVMETTFGLPKYVFPTSEELFERITGFVSESLSAGDVPVLLGYSLGKAQELICAVADLGVRVLLHDAVFKMTEVYRKLGDFPLPEYYKFGAGMNTGGCILVFPPNLARSDTLLQIGNRRSAVASGWGMDSSAKYRYGVDEVFPLSDHADYPDLHEFVEKVNPNLVITMHGFSAEFAADLRRRGVEAWSFGGDDQLELHL